MDGRHTYIAIDLFMISGRILPKRIRDGSWKRILR